MLKLQSSSSMLTPYGVSFEVNYHDTVFNMKIDNGVWFFLIFGSLKNNLMKVYLVPNSIVNYTKFVSSKLLIYFVISNGTGCKPAQARVF